MSTKKQTQSWPVMVHFDSDAETSGMIDLPSLEVFLEPEELENIQKPENRTAVLRALGWG